MFVFGWSRGRGTIVRPSLNVWMWKRENVHYSPGVIPKTQKDGKLRIYRLSWPLHFMNVNRT